MSTINTKWDVLHPEILAVNFDELSDQDRVLSNASKNCCIRADIYLDMGRVCDSCRIYPFCQCNLRNHSKEGIVKKVDKYTRKEVAPPTFIEAVVPVVTPSTPEVSEIVDPNGYKDGVSEEKVVVSGLSGIADPKIKTYKITVADNIMGEPVPIPVKRGRGRPPGSKNKVR